MADDRRPALAASVALHAAILGAALIALHHATPLAITADAVPVSIVTSAAPNLRAALEAPEEAPATTPEPTPEPTPSPPAAQEAPPAPAPPKVRETPAEPKPTPAPTPTPPPTPKPKPAKAPKELDLSALASDAPKPRAAKASPSKALDLASLSSSLVSSKHAEARGSLDLASLANAAPGGSRHAAGARGAAHPETAKVARKALGAATGLSGDEIGALTAKLGRLWNPNCGVEGSSGVVIRVRMRLGPGGGLNGAPEIVGKTGDASADVIRAAAVRAAGAVARGAPYTEISPEHLKTMNDFIFKFDARQVCNG